MVLWRMRIWSLDLDEALRAYGLIATTCLVQMWWVVHEADGALGSVLVQESLYPLAVDMGIFGKLHLLWGHIRLRRIAGAGRERSKRFGASTEERRRR